LVSTPADPATARKNESIYAFYIRSIFGQISHAWQLEKERLEHSNKSIWTLENEMIQRHEFASIRSKKHKIKTITQKKKALSYFDSKRWLFDCGVHSVPYGSKNIRKYYNTCVLCN
jgi:hypothetical protein